MFIAAAPEAATWFSTQYSEVGMKVHFHEQFQTISPETILCYCHFLPICMAAGTTLFQSLFGGRMATRASGVPPPNFPVDWNPWMFQRCEDTADSWWLSPLHYEQGVVTSVITHILWDLIKNSVNWKLTQNKTPTILSMRKITLFSVLECFPYPNWNFVIDFFDKMFNKNMNFTWAPLW